MGVGIKVREGKGMRHRSVRPIKNPKVLGKLRGSEFWEALATSREHYGEWFSRRLGTVGHPDPQHAATLGGPDCG